MRREVGASAAGFQSETQAAGIAAEDEVDDDSTTEFELVAAPDGSPRNRPHRVLLEQEENPCPRN
jgi:hypothetical protein